MVIIILLVLEIGWQSAGYVVGEGAGIINIPVSFSGNPGKFEIVVNGSFNAGFALSKL